MRTIGEATLRPVAFTLALGILGGAALIATVSVTTRGPMIYVPYAALVVITALFLRAENVQPFMRRFALALGAFMLATLLLYVFIGLVAAKTLSSISLGGHAWRLGSMLAIGAVLSAAVAQLTGTRPRQ